MSIRPLSPALVEKARVELNEDPNRVKDDLQHIKDWLAKQPHIKAMTDDQWLLAFMRGCKFSLERTKEKLDLYYTVRTTAPEFFKIKHTDALFEELLSTGACLMLPKPIGPDGHCVALSCPGKFDPSKYLMTDYISFFNLILKIIMLDNDNAMVAGIRSIADLDNVTMGHFLQMTPMTMKKTIVVTQDATPFRMKGTHYLNTPPGFEAMLNTMKSFMNEKNKNRVHVHNKKYEEMYKTIPKEILPAEYGGNGGTVEEIKEYWRQKVKQYSAWLEEDYKCGTDESKRPGKPKTSEDMFGVEGSFRQLEFD